MAISPRQFTTQLFCPFILRAHHVVLCWAHKEMTGSTHLQNLGQELAQHLVASIAKEAVGVERVVFAIESQGHLVLWVLHVILGHKGDLGGGSPKVQCPNCWLSRAKPLAY